MLRRIIDKIRSAIKDANYDMTYHAVEEMAEDELGIADVESAVLSGKYVIEGVGTNGYTSIGVVGRFKETGIFLIITVYEIS